MFSEQIKQELAIGHYPPDSTVSPEEAVERVDAKKALTELRGKFARGLINSGLAYYRMYDLHDCQKWTFKWDRPEVRGEIQFKYLTKAYDLLSWIWQDCMEERPKRMNIPTGDPKPKGVKVGVTKNFIIGEIYVVGPGTIFLGFAEDFLLANGFVFIIEPTHHKIFFHHEN